MTSPQWQQSTITFTDPRTAEQLATAHLTPILAEAETRHLITTWFYVRKGAWRLRYLPAVGTTAAERYMTSELKRLTRAGHIDSAVAGIYEPETHAFGGTEAMDAAHQLWHHDSRHLLTRTPATSAHDQELSIMLCAAMMRAADLDWYEQGDVWARVADHRDPPEPALVASLQHATRRLLLVDPASLTRPDAPLAGSRALFDAFTAAGIAIRQLEQAGKMRRGLRAILAHHVIFTWNRRGIPGLRQATVATAAKTVIFGPDPRTDSLPSRGDS